MRCSIAFKTHNCFRHEESGALKTCQCRGASASRTSCLFIYLFICWLKLLGPAEHKIAYYYSHGRFIISIATRVCNSAITQLSGNMVKHRNDSNVCLNWQYDGEKNIVLGLGRSDPDHAEPTEAADAIIRSSSPNLNTVEASDIKNNNNNSP